MGDSERNQAFQSAERLLRGGRVSAALQEFRALADAAPRDLQMLNRIGDSLARAGRNGEAIGYYERIADQFASAGFYPKAVAIVKKAARLDPDRVEVLVRLGEYNLRQKFLGEAKAHLLRAGDSLVRSGQIERARQVFERLVAADPTDVLNRVRLAEARAAGGDAARATEELVAAARQFAASGRREDAENTFRRAQKLSPASAEPVSALAAYLASVGREDDGLRLLAATAEERPDDTVLRGEWFVLLEHLGRTEDSAAFLAGADSDTIPPAAVERVLTEAIARGRADDLWARLDPLVERWTKGKRFEKATTLLERLTRTEPTEHLPALERLLATREAEGDPRATGRVVERLLAALRRRGVVDRLETLRDRLRELDPASPSLIEDGAALPRPTPVPEPAREEEPDPVAAPAAAPSAGAYLRFEAPAVPLSPADHEFVTGHLTEAEVFLKYSLADEAVNQLREVVARFPGHVDALERLAELLSSRGDPGERQAVLTDLAWARRASGDERGARSALESAGTLGPLPEDVRAAALHFALATEGQTDSPKPPAPAPKPPPPPPVRRAPAPEQGGTDSSDEEWVIEFEADEAGEAEPAPAPAAEPRPYARPASPDMIDEIRSLADGTRVEEALRKVEALRILGFGGAELDALEEDVRGRRSGEAEERFDEADLSSLTAALASDLSETAVGPDPDPADEEEAEQSLDEVFDAFKRHVDETVHAEDFRTRYDLGIAYKEMGLLDEALAAFEEATRSPELFREACTMLALCHRERGEIDEAVAWYRRALDGEDEGTPDLHGIRYDLAEVLLERGETDDALLLFRAVLDADPSYRDVRRYVNELQSRVDG